jgi:hypothetical protein
MSDRFAAHLPPVIRNLPAHTREEEGKNTITTSTGLSR